ncbi:MAG TPA: 2-C-methyl-D-erythritol 2,4-cyclodiphosphate synthase [Mariprofundaceae bacterium]|nr:2-C-methyl-D-erythritol 2,4-cyclodiphosphate synthase [Mariprofundaceae bacterium]
MNFRIGQGFDVHGFEQGRKLMLGGVEVPHTHGLAGHSDADVLIHAICDALLGAAGLGDLGRHFPDTDAKYAGADSRLLLADVMRQLHGLGWKVVNIDATVIAQVPKLAPFIMSMRECLGSLLGVPVDCVNIKGTTTEHLGFTGRKEGIAAQAVVLIQQ